MHDKRGVLIEVGDYLKVDKYGGSKVTKQVGLVIRTIPDSDSCNVETAHVSAYYGIQVQLNNACETEVVMKADGSDPVEDSPPEAEVAEPEKTE